MARVIVYNEFNEHKTSTTCGDDPGGHGGDDECGDAHDDDDDGDVVALQRSCGITTKLWQDDTPLMDECDMKTAASGTILWVWGPEHPRLRRYGVSAMCPPALRNLGMYF